MRICDNFNPENFSPVKKSRAHDPKAKAQLRPDQREHNISPFELVQTIKTS